MASRRAITEQMLREWKPVDLEGSEVHRDGFLSLCRIKGDPFSRATFPGHFTASALVLDSSLQRILMVHHKKLGMWLQPGGHFDAGDNSSMETALREVREETGLTQLQPALDGLLDIDCHPIPSHGDSTAHFHYDLRHLFVAGDSRLSLQMDEIHGADWFTPEQAQQTGTDESVLRMVRAAATILDGAFSRRAV